MAAEQFLHHEPTLGEIKRPHTQVVSLSLGDGIIVNDEFAVVVHGVHADETYPEFIITREMTVPVLTDPSKVCWPYRDEAGRMGRFASLPPIGLRRRNPMLFIGERYMLGFLERDTYEGNITFGIASTVPLSVQQRDFSEFDAVGYLGQISRFRTTA